MLLLTRIFPKCIFAKCTQLACLLNFASNSSNDPCVSQYCNCVFLGLDFLKRSFCVSQLGLSWTARFLSLPGASRWGGWQTIDINYEVPLCILVLKMSRQRECCVCLFRHDQQSRTNVHFLVFHLTIADTIISFITMPMEIIWRIIIEVVLEALMLM